MKTLAFTIFLATIPTISMAQGGGSWLFGQNLEDRENDSAYQMEAAGWDVRVYEFTPVANENVTCIFISGSNGPFGFQCFEKE